MLRATLHAFKRRYENSLSTEFNLRTTVSEIIGVAGFVFVGCGAAALVSDPVASGFDGDSTSGMLASAIVGLTFGFAIYFMISATAHNNSDQLNPVRPVTLCSSTTGLHRIIWHCAILGIAGAVLAVGQHGRHVETLWPPHLCRAGSAHTLASCLIAQNSCHIEGQPGSALSQFA